MSFLLELNEAARLTPNHTLKNQLRACAADLKTACTTLAGEVTMDNGKQVSMLFARGWRLLCRAKNTPPIGRGGAKREGARLAA